MNSVRKLDLKCAAFTFAAKVHADAHSDERCTCALYFFIVHFCIKHDIVLVADMNMREIMYERLC